MAVDITSKGEFALAVYQILAAVPAGRVSTYGQLAKLAGFPRHARFVGRLLANLPEGSKLPWWRVVRGDGVITQGDRQKKLLQTEGAVVLGNKVSLAACRFEP